MPDKLFDDIRILMVDDKEDNLLLGTYMTQRSLGFNHVGEAMSGMETLEYLRENPQTHIVLLDCMMPQMNGIETFKRIQKDPTLRHVNVVFQTGKTAPNELKEILSTGCTYIIRKPYGAEDIRAFVYPLVSKIRRRRRFEEQMLTAAPPAENFIQVYSFEQAETAALQLGVLCDRSVDVAEAFYGLIENAIEHGHLEIGGQMKRKLLRDKNYYQDREKKRELPENKDKVVRIKIEIRDKESVFTISDQGKGYLYFAEHCILGVFDAVEPCGRGLNVAYHFFHRIEHSEKGNEIRCTYRTSGGVSCD